MACAPESPDLGEHAAEIDLAFLVVIFSQDLALEAGRYFFGEVDRRTPIVAVDGKNGKLCEAALLGGVLATISARFSSVG